MVSKYEEQRLANIAANKALLDSLGLTKIKIAPPVAAASADDSALYSDPPRSSKKRVRVSTASGAQKKKTRQETDPTSSPVEGLRRSVRNEGRRISYRDADLEAKNREREEEYYVQSGREVDDDHDYHRDLQRKSVKVGVRIHDPKQFGHIPGMAVGTSWKLRSDCSKDAVHAPYVCGISGSAKSGAYSVVLSGGYMDDVDEGFAFTYTGAGGRDLKGTKDKPKNLRTAPQTKDQTFENTTNKALLVSSKTKKPVRVVRGYKLKSIYAPTEEEGYRYDGLYIVQKAWLADGIEGFKVCRYVLQRMDGQPSLPTRERSDLEVSTPVADEETESETKVDSNAEETAEDAADDDGEPMAKRPKRNLPRRKSSRTTRKVNVIAD